MSAEQSDVPCPRAPMRPVEFVADCPACERPSHVDRTEWEQVTSGAFSPHGPGRWPVCEYCNTQFEVVAVQVRPVGEISPVAADAALDAALAADPAIAASLAEWERTSGPLPGENSPAAAPFADTDCLTCRDPDIDLDALERAHGRVLTMYRSCMVGGAASVAAEWEALLVASGYGWPATPKEALPHAR